VNHLLSKWDDPVYKAAKEAKAQAYTEFCRVATGNPFIYGQDGFDAYYQANTVPAREKFVAASQVWRAEVDRILAGAR
jgi:hypothetical protein